MPASGHRVATDRLSVFDLLVLRVDRDRQMRHAAARQCRAAGQRRRSRDLRRTHDRRRMFDHILEQTPVIDILLRRGLSEVVVRQPGDRQHRRPIELGIVELR